MVPSVRQLIENYFSNTGTNFMKFIHCIYIPLCLPADREKTWWRRVNEEKRSCSIEIHAAMKFRHFLCDLRVQILLGPNEALCICIFSSGKEVENVKVSWHSWRKLSGHLFRAHNKSLKLPASPFLPFCSFIGSEPRVSLAGV